MVVRKMSRLRCSPKNLKSFMRARKAARLSTEKESSKRPVVARSGLGLGLGLGLGFGLGLGIGLHQHSTCHRGQLDVLRGEGVEAAHLGGEGDDDDDPVRHVPRVRDVILDRACQATRLVELGALNIDVVDEVGVEHALEDGVDQVLLVDEHVHLDRLHGEGGGHHSGGRELEEEGAQRVEVVVGVIHEHRQRDASGAAVEPTFLLEEVERLDERDRRQIDDVEYEAAAVVEAELPREDVCLGQIVLYGGSPSEGVDVGVARVVRGVGHGVGLLAHEQRVVPVVAHVEVDETPLLQDALGRAARRRELLLHREADVAAVASYAVLPETHPAHDLVVVHNSLLGDGRAVVELSRQQAVGEGTLRPVIELLDGCDVHECLLVVVAEVLFGEDGAQRLHELEGLAHRPARVEHEHVERDEDDVLAEVHEQRPPLLLVHVLLALPPPRHLTLLSLLALELPPLRTAHVVAALLPVHVQHLVLGHLGQWPPLQPDTRGVAAGGDLGGRGWGRRGR
eukprot:scaffold84748_cov63-Phaeocystis_antarctica.AAC.3